MMKGVTVISGANGAIGGALTDLIAADGSPVAMLDLDFRDDAPAAASPNVRRFRVDIKDFAAVDATVREIEADFGPVTAAANLAAIHRIVPFESIDDDQWDAMLKTNVMGTVNVCRAVTVHMEKRRAGAIVNVASNHLFSSTRVAAHYVSSKFAVVGLTKALAKEKGQVGIRVNAVAPGPVDTPMWRGSRSDAEIEDAMAKRVASIPLGRIARINDVVDAIFFLLSDRSALITGHVIPLDGGESIV